MAKERKCIDCGCDITHFELEFYCQDCYFEEQRKQEYLRNLQWEENMNSLYHYDEAGNCDGFTRY